MAMESQLSAFRFVGNKIVPITSDEEIGEIEEALSLSGPFAPAAVHLKTALDLFADRENPEYRNSIKESISAVEAMCKIIAGSPKGTLNAALKAIERDGKVKIHSTLKSAYDKLYAYTSTADGVRHGMEDVKNLCVEDARYKLIVCSAFINYLKVKCDKAKILL